MNLVTEPYPVQVARWPKSGRHILAQFDDDSVMVFQAYRTAIGQFAVKNGYFGGGFSLNRMSWIKSNFLCGTTWTCLLIGILQSRLMSTLVTPQ